MYTLYVILELIGITALIFGIIRWRGSKRRGVSPSPFKKITLAGALILIASSALITTTPQFKADEKSEDTDASSTSSSSSRDYTALKLGMTKSRVQSIAGKPQSKTTTAWTYKKGNVYFADGKTVSGGDVGTLQDQTEQSASSSKAKAQDKQDRIKSYAQAFGRKPTDTISQRPGVYKSSQIDDDTTEYMWSNPASDVPTLIRFDTASNSMTKVYLYDSTAKNGIGKQLFTGSTIKQKAKVVNNY